MREVSLGVLVEVFVVEVIAFSPKASHGGAVILYRRVQRSGTAAGSIPNFSTMYASIFNRQACANPLLSGYNVSSKSKMSVS